MLMLAEIRYFGLNPKAICIGLHHGYVSNSDPMEVKGRLNRLCICLSRQVLDNTTHYLNSIYKNCMYAHVQTESVQGFLSCNIRSNILDKS